MKSQEKKSVVFLSLILITVLLLSACQSGGINSSSGTSSSSQSSVQSSATVETVHKIKLMGPSKFVDWAKWEDREELASWRLFLELLKKRNMELEFEWIVPEQYDTVIQTRMAAALDLPDMVNISPLDDMTAVSLGMQGTIIDVNEAIKKYSDGTIEKKFAEGHLNYSKSLTTAPDGKRYWFASAITANDVVLDSGNVVPNLQVINNAIRKDWLDKLGLPMPTTVEEWINALRAFRDNDMNGNGAKDEMLLFDNYSYSFFTGVAQWFGLVPDIVAVDPNNDKVTSPWYQEGVKDYFKLMRELAKEGIFDVGMVGATEEAVNQRIAENKVSALRSYAIASWFEDLIKDAKNPDYAILPPLQAKEGVKPLMLTDAADLSYNKWAITENCKDVEGVIKLIDYAFSDEYSRVAGAGIEGVDYKISKDEKTGEDKIELINQNLTPKETYQANKGGMGVFMGNVLPSFQGRGESTCTAQKLVEAFPNERGRRGELRRLAIIEYRPFVTSPFSSSMYAIASPIELNILNKYSTALKSYSEELSMNLILGNESLDNWDAHIKKLQELGLDKIIEVNQARYARYKAAN